MPRLAGKPQRQGCVSCARAPSPSPAADPRGAGSRGSRLLNPTDAMILLELGQLALGLFRLPLLSVAVFAVRLGPYDLKACPAGARFDDPHCSSPSASESVQSRSLRPASKTSSFVQWPVSRT